MSAQIISFEPRAYMEIDSGFVRGVNPPTPKRFEYWCDYVEPGDGRITIWSGGSYPEAVRAAHEWERDGYRVVDVTGGRA